MAAMLKTYSYQSIYHRALVEHILGVNEEGELSPFDKYIVKEILKKIRDLNSPLLDYVRKRGMVAEELMLLDVLLKGALKENALMRIINRR